MDNLCRVCGEVVNPDVLNEAQLKGDSFCYCDGYGCSNDSRDEEGGEELD